MKMRYPALVLFNSHKDSDLTVFLSEPLEILGQLYVELLDFSTKSIDYMKLVEIYSLLSFREAGTAYQGMVMLRVEGERTHPRTR